MREHLNITLALGSTSYWPVYLGILEVLEREEIPFHSLAVSGTGALVGAVYAFLPNVEKALAKMEGMWEKRKYFDYEMAPFENYQRIFEERSGRIYSEEELDSLLSFAVEEHRWISDAVLNLGVGCYDLRTKKNIFFTEGCLFSLLKGTMSFPGYFDSYLWEGHYLIDPYFVSPSPLELAKLEWCSDISVAVCFETYRRPFPFAGEIGASGKFAFFSSQEHNRILLNKDLFDSADIVFEVKPSPKMSFRDLFEAGRLAAKQKLALLYRLIKNRKYSPWRRLEVYYDTKEDFCSLTS
ncbi:MAG: hypothetical protein D6805_02170 [Planctomycetota bacterium]|nr:MAG: hypothetical protein D6805_02170 [Planctomycetota bacterium]